MDEDIFATFLGVVPTSCEVRYIDQHHGRGLFSSQNFNKNDVIFTEKPLVSLQQVYNRQEAWCCAHCRTFLGNLDDQFSSLLGLTKMNIKSTIHLPFSEKFSNNSTTKTNQNSKNVVECIWGCGENYCSEKCRDESFTQNHNLLCVGQIPSTDHPLYQFKQYSIQNNELFLIAAMVLARIITAWKNSNKSFNIIELQQRLLSQFTHKLWSDMYHETFTPSDLQRMAYEALETLKQAFASITIQNWGFNQNDVLTLAPLFEFEFFSKFLALLEINEIAIGITSPLEPYCKSLPQFPDAERAFGESVLGPLMKTLQARNEGACGEEDDDAEMNDESDGDDDVITSNGGEDQINPETEENEGRNEQEDPIFPNFEGIGVYPGTAMMNHSCMPNCIVDFKTDHVLIVTALRPIQRGEELRFSYIDEYADVEERQNELRSYGFVCQCPKCVRQMQQHLNIKNKS